MEKIHTSISFLRYLRNAEHQELLMQSMKVLEVSVKRLPILAPAWRELQGLYRRILPLYRRPRKMELTRVMKELDRQRDDCFVLLKMTLRLAARGIDPEAREAAKRVGPIVRKFRNANREAYSANSGMITAVVDVLRRPVYHEAVSILRLDDLLALLGEKNRAFREAWVTRAHDNRQRHIVRLGDVRRRVDTAFMKIIDTVNALYKVHLLAGGDPAYGHHLETLIFKLSSLLNDAKETYDRRIKRRPGAAVEDTTHVTGASAPAYKHPSPDGDINNVHGVLVASPVGGEMIVGRCVSSGYVRRVGYVHRAGYVCHAGHIWMPPVSG